MGRHAVSANEGSILALRGGRAPNPVSCRREGHCRGRSTDEVRKPNPTLETDFLRGPRHWIVEGAASQSLVPVLSPKGAGVWPFA